MGLGDKVAARLQTPGSSSTDLKDRAASRGASASSPGARAAAQPAAVPNADPVPNAGTAPDLPSRFERQYSTASWNTVSTLQQFELQVEEMEKQVRGHANTLASPPPEGLPLEMRNQLAQLHGDFNRILDTKIDAVLTSDLNSGKDDARAKRKELSAKCGNIIEEIESLVKQYDSTRKASSG